MRLHRTFIKNSKRNPTRWRFHRQRSPLRKFSPTGGHLVMLVVITVLVLSIYSFLKPQPPFEFSLLSYHSPTTSVRSDTWFDNWIAKESEVALDKILKNIIAPGVVVASPSDKDPDYHYQWTRDSAITMNTLVEEYFRLQTGKAKEHERENLLLDHILDYFNTSYVLQRVTNPSGDFSLEDRYRGLGEPKFNIDNTAFQYKWGRPQNDGPPLRLITTIKFLTRLNETATNGTPTVDSGSNGLFNAILESRTGLNPQLKPYMFANEYELIENVLYFDMKFLALNWNESCFDPWEELYGRHFFTTLVQYDATVICIGLLEDLKDGYGYFPGDDKELLEQLKYARDNLWLQLIAEENFIQWSELYIVETPMRDLKRRSTGLDTAVLLGILTTYRNHDVVEQVLPFRVSDTIVLSTFHELVNHMSTIYPINNGRTILQGIALGRYPEDIYDGTGFTGGNPWFLCTLAASEYLLRLITEYRKLETSISIGNESRDFWHDILGDFENDNITTIPYNTVLFNQIMHRLFYISDSFLKVVQEHVSRESYEMSEQFDRWTGFLTGAQDLTWSYSSFLDTTRLRSEVWKLIQ